MRIAGEAVPHESARGHVTGEALYTDDLLARFPPVLHAWPVLAPHAHALVTALDAAPALEEPGVVSTLTEADVPGEGNSGANRHDEPLFPTEVMYHRQPVAWVLGETVEAAQRGAARVQVSYQPLPAILTVEDAIAAQSFHAGPLRQKPFPRARCGSKANCASAARSIFIWRRSARWHGWTNRAASVCNLPRSIPPKLRK
jgi:xanthine dehydrogenase large subunit